MGGILGGPQNMMHILDHPEYVESCITFSFSFCLIEVAAACRSARARTCGIEKHKYFARVSPEGELPMILHDFHFVVRAKSAPRLKNHRRGHYRHSPHPWDVGNRSQSGPPLKVSDSLQPC